MKWKQIFSDCTSQYSSDPCASDPVSFHSVRTLGIVVLLLCVASPYPALGGLDGTDLSSMSIEELMNVEIVSGASRYEQKSVDAPAAVTIITSEEIAMYGYQTLSDILQSIRGFHTTYDRNYKYAGVRGFGRPGDYNTRLLLLVDGHRLNDNIYGQASIGGDFLLDLEIVEKVEVIRGPSSSVYGTGAFLGVINVVTKGSEEMDGVRVSASSGSHSSYNGQIDCGVASWKGVGAVISGSFYDSEGQDLFFKEFNDPETNNGLAVDCDYEQRTRLFTNLSYNDFSFQGMYSSREKGVPTAAWDCEFNDSQTRSIDAIGYLILQHSHTWNKETELTSNLSYNWYDYTGDFAFDYGEEDEPDIVVNKDKAAGEWWRSELQFTREMFEKHKVVAGAELQIDSRMDQRNYDEEVYLDDSQSSRCWSLHVQDEYSIRNNLIVNAGIRHDNYETFGGTTNPRLALIFNPVERTNFKLLYGEAFRAPNAYELYYNDGDDTQKANPDLKPEEIQTYELVWDQYIGKGIRGCVSIYQLRIDNLIDTETDPEDDLLVFHNVSEIRAEGAEVELTGTIFKDYKCRASYSYQNNEDVQTGELMTNSPRHLAKINVITPLLSNILSAGTGLQYMGKRKTLAGNSTDSFLLANLTLVGRPWGDRLSVSTSVYNIFDKEYGDPGSGEHIQDLIIQNGRSVLVKLRYRF